MMNKTILYILVSFAFILLCEGQVSAQEYRSQTRKGNKAFMEKGRYDAALKHYKSALKSDSLYIPAIYNMAYVLHSDRRDSLENAKKDILALEYLDKLSEKIKGTEYEFDYNFNRGVIYIDMENWQGAVDAFKQCLKHTPGDMKALENYVYAKEHLHRQQQQQQQQSGQGNGQNNQNNDQNNDQNSGTNNDQQNKNDKQGQGGGQSDKISTQAAQQMLQAIQDKEKKTQDKVNKKKAAMMQSNQKEKNW